MMSKGIICDACGTSVAFTMNNRESDSGEESAWITLSADNVHDHHACTRECAKSIIDGEFGLKVEAAYEVIAEIARVMREGAEDE